MKKQLQNDADIVALITRIQEQLVSLDRKVDTLVSRCFSRPAETKPIPKPFQQPVTNHVQPAGRQENRFRERIMYKAICADCQQDCEIPFKPNADRPVYCKACFSRRKANNSLKSNMENKPKEVVSTPVVTVDQPQIKEKKKLVAKKKTVVNKKQVSPKKKSKK